MALYNEILVGRFARGIQKYFGAKGSPPIKQLAGDLYIVHKLFNGAENRYLEGWSRFGWVAGQAAAVGNKSAVRLRNPPTSNVIAVIEKISMFTGLAGDQVDFSRAKTSTDLGTVLVAVAGQNFDSREARLPSLILSSEALVGTGDLAALISTFNLNANISFDVIQTDIQEIPLLPGDALQLANANTNATLSVSWWWRERALEESERA